MRCLVISFACLVGCAASVPANAAPSTELVGKLAETLKHSKKALSSIGTASRISAMSLRGSTIGGDFWISFTYADKVDADPVHPDGRVTFTNANARVDLSIGVPQNWQLYVACKADINADLKWEATMTSSSSVLGTATRDPSTGYYYFTTPVADGSVPTYYSMIALTAAQSPTPPLDWTFEYCDVLPFTTS